MEEDDFEIVTVEHEDPASGEMLVRNLALSVDPYMRMHLADFHSAPVRPLHAPMQGSAVGSIAGQVARLRGTTRVVGSVGSAAKAR